MPQIHVPNLFIVTGQPGNGKTTISKQLGSSLQCEVIHTDDLYHEWMTSNGHSSIFHSRTAIRSHYTTLAPAIKLAWQQHLISYILTRVKYAKLDLIVEGWLLSHLLAKHKQQLHNKASVLQFDMRKHSAYMVKVVFSPIGRDSTRVMHAACNYLSNKQAVELAKRDILYQTFEDLTSARSKSNSYAKLQHIDLPNRMTDASVLDVGCNTGYFSIRASQRGANVIGMDYRKSVLLTASRLANAVYRCKNITFMHDDITTTKITDKFDYILAISLLPSLGDAQEDVMTKLKSLLKPTGQLILELPLIEDTNLSIPIITNRKTSKYYRFITNNTLSTLTSDLECTYACCRSLNTSANALQRYVFKYSPRMS